MKTNQLMNSNLNNMPEYKCNNTECKSFNEVKFDRSTIRIVNEEVVDSATKCPDCGLDRELVKEEGGFTTYMHGSANICRH